MILNIELTERALAQMMGVTPAYAHRLISKQDGKQIGKQLGKQFKGIKDVSFSELDTTTVSNQVSKVVSNQVSNQRNEKEKVSPDPIKKKKEKKEEPNLFPSVKDSSAQSADKKEEFDTDAFVVAWNTFFKGTHVSLIRALDAQRKAMLKARVEDYGKEDLRKAMVNYKNSKFFRENPQYANFGWFIRPTNFLKILEGNYNK